MKDIDENNPELNLNNYLIYFDFHCYNCDETFAVHLGYMQSKEKIVCPNCNQPLPDKTFDLIKQATTNLENALIELEKTNTPNTGWAFSLCWNNINRLPEKKSKYDSLIIKSEEPYKPFKPVRKDPY